jgi:hypothetical protein
MYENVKQKLVSVNLVLIHGIEENIVKLKCCIQLKLYSVHLILETE